MAEQVHSKLDGFDRVRRHDLVFLLFIGLDQRSQNIEPVSPNHCRPLTAMAFSLRRPLLAYQRRPRASMTENILK